MQTERPTLEVAVVIEPTVTSHEVFDVSTIIQLRRTVKDAALVALSRAPGRPKERDWQLEAARTEIEQLTEAIKAQAIELSIVRGKVGWG